MKQSICKATKQMFLIRLQDSKIDAAGHFVATFLVIY